METARTATLAASVVLMGLIAGLFYAYSMSGLPGLARSSDRTFVEAMQNINRAILNGWFALIFGGSLVVTAVAGALFLSAEEKSALPWIIAGLVLYIAVLVITTVVNVAAFGALVGALIVHARDNMG